VRDRCAKGLDPSSNQVHNSGAALWGAMKCHFGSHDKALAAAGIDAASTRRKLAWPPLPTIAFQ
jgi:hypothetical protein